MRKYHLKTSKAGHEYSPARLIEGPNRWYIEFMIWDVQQEKLVRKRVGVGREKSEQAKKRKALLKVDQINAALEAGMVIDRSDGAEEKPQKKKVLKLGEAMQRMVDLKVAATKERTQQGYRSFLSVFEAWARAEKLWNRPVEQFGRKHVYAFTDYLIAERGVGNKTHNNYLIYLKSLFNAMESRELIEKNPAKNVPSLKAVTKTHRNYRPDEQQRLEQWLQKNDPELFLFTRFIYFAFIRPAELLRLQVKQVDMVNRLINIDSDQTKNSKQQSVQIPDGLYECICQNIDIETYDPDHFLFSKGLVPGPTQWSRVRVSERHRKALEETGLYDGKLTMYSWKHTGACNAYRAGMDINTLRNQLRHHSLDMTAVYLRDMGLQMGQSLRGLRW